MIVIALLLAASPTSASFLEAIDTPPDEAAILFTEPLVYGTRYVSIPPGCLKVPGKLRVAVAKRAVEFAKDYAASDAFKAVYASTWASAEPRDLGLSREQNLALRLGDLQMAEATTTHNIQALSAWLANNKHSPKYETYQHEYDALVASAPTPADHQLAVEHITEAAQADYSERQAAYDAALSDWLKRKDPNVAIALRIDAFLEVATTVDFKAKTILKNGHTVFADPTIERKSKLWKQIYRLGPEVTAVLKTAAKKWRAETSQ